MTVGFMFIGLILVIGFSLMVGGFIALGLLLNARLARATQHLDEMERALKGGHGTWQER